MAARAATDELIALLAKALTERFSHDPSCPGVHIAHVVKRFAPKWVDGVPAHTETVIKPIWYVAAQRFTGSFGAGRTIVDREEGEDLDEVIFKLASRIAAGIPKIREQLSLARAVRA